MVLFTLSVFGLLLFLWISFGGTLPLQAERYRITASFPEATPLVQEADVRLAGIDVGKVKAKELDKDSGRSIATIDLDARYAPIPRDTRAILRQKTLLGETYVELTPGDPRSGTLEDGQSLAKASVDQTVELDEIFRIFNRDTRRDFSDWIEEGSVAVGGSYGEDFNDALGNLAPFATGGARLLEVLDRQEGSLRRLVRDGGRTLDAISRRPGELRGLIVNANDAFGALASRDEALGDTIEIMPTFLRETRATLGRLEGFSRDTHPLVRDLQGPAGDLGPTLRDLGDLAPDLERLFRDLDPLIDASETGLPAAERLLRGAEPVFEGLHMFLPELNPVLARLGFGRLTVAQFLTVGGAALAGNGKGGYVGGQGGGHYLPQIALIDADSFAINRTRPAFDRGNSYIAPNAYERAIALGVTESFDCKPAGGRKRDPTPGVPPLFAGAEPPCFVQPPLLFQNQRFPKLERGRAPLVRAPSGREGTEPATP